MDELILFSATLWQTLCEMAPYLLFGFFFAGVLSIFISPEFVERHLGGRGLLPVVKATILGIPLPLCSCGVIPVAASLRRHRATRAATTAFLISTPQTGVDSIFVTFSLLGPVFAVFRPLAAFVNGLLGGAVVMWTDPAEKEDPAPQVDCDAECCDADGGQSRFVRALRYGFVTLAEDIAVPLLVGLALAAVISTVVPKDVLPGLIGTGVGAMLVMMVLGIPMYVCATASVPIAAALMAVGLTPGAALVFLMTGPATNAAAVATIWKIMGRRTAVVYLATVALTAIGSGVLLDYLFTTADITAGAYVPWMLPDVIKVISAIALLAVLGYALFRAWWVPSSPAPTTEDSSQQIALAIGGMTCSHCAESVRRALNECRGVQSAQVDLKTGRAIIVGNHVDIDALADAVEQLGYTVSPIEQETG